MVWPWQASSAGKQPGPAGWGCFLTNALCSHKGAFASQALPHFMAGCKFCIGYFFFFYDSFSWRLKFWVSFLSREVLESSSHPPRQSYGQFDLPFSHFLVLVEWLPGLFLPCKQHTGRVIAHADEGAWTAAGLRLVALANVNSSSMACWRLCQIHPLQVGHGLLSLSGWFGFKEQWVEQTNDAPIKPQGECRSVRVSLKLGWVL